MKLSLFFVLLSACASKVYPETTLEECIEHETRGTSDLTVVQAGNEAEIWRGKEYLITVRLEDECVLEFRPTTGRGVIPVGSGGK